VQVKLEGTLNAKYLFGQPVPKAAVSLELSTLTEPPMLLETAPALAVEAEAPSARAYLYYNPEVGSEAPPVKLTVSP
jgi:hypothetical protein